MPYPLVPPGDDAIFLDRDIEPLHAITRIGLPHGGIDIESPALRLLAQTVLPALTLVTRPAEQGQQVVESGGRSFIERRHPHNRRSGQQLLAASRVEKGAGLRVEDAKAQEVMRQGIVEDGVLGV